MRPCSRPRSVRLDGGTATGVIKIMKSRRDGFRKAALPPSCYLTGKTADPRDQHRNLLVQVQPAVSTGRRGERRSFWGAGLYGPAVGALRQKVRWQTPYRRLVPPADPTAATRLNLAAQPQGMPDRDSLQPLEPNHEKREYPGCAP
jgi:hypothetical protein